MKFKITEFGNRNEILKFPDHYVNVAVTVSDEGVTANEDGRKIVPAGTILGGGVLADETALAVATNAAGAEGVLFNDVDVTSGPTPGAMLIHGFVDTSKLPEAPAAEAVTALKQITFVE